MERTVVITGAGGYVGRHVTSAVAALGYEPIALVRRHRPGDFDSLTRVVEADVLEPTFDITSVAAPDRIAAVVHLAWQDGFVHNAASHLERLSDHYRFLTSLPKAGIARIAALGSMHEIGYWEGAVTAETPTNPVTLYGIAKDALRRSAMLSIADRAAFAWLRAYYILGDDRRNSSIFAKLLEAADRGEKVFPFTTGKTLYDFIDVSELGRQIAVAAVSDGVTGVINVATGRPESLASRVERFIDENGLDITLQYGAFPDRPYDSPGIWGDATRIRGLMATSLFDGRA
ncbi:NAD-dependent epimerase/dehydratase family protein [Microbacterium enclense]|uniref:dTDP-6-deoxy-L-talose 4-dehydrogenase (NAD+) n=1 Tax=Microbacterium enclense TaxID=993073 RepID=A0A1G6K7A0_9MICO|nr:NAD-dependent epimerase/dehydratase family protein [Microbacterium enclense]KSU54057.1 epimerase [Microbacterium enclense]SDC26870.1 dTDP-6-deoxy-L-talose 4-dehydrogenase (NAD+) [Microbacterium enclense]